MLTTITAEGFPGLTRPVTVDPDGVNVIRGASGTGKTMTLRAVVFVIHGTDLHGKPFDAAIYGEPVEATLTLKTGTTIRRRKTPGGSQAREIRKPGEASVGYTKEADFREAIGILGADAVRHVLTPLAWVPLAQGPGGGRPLRDLLTSILPPVDLRAIVAESVEVQDGDPMDEKGATEARRQANKAADEAAGVTRAKADEVERLRQPVEGPGAGAVDEAQETLAKEGAWQEHVDAHFVWESACESIANAARIRAGWLRRLEALGERPDEGDAEAIAAAEAREREARTRANETAAAVDEAREAWREAKAALTEAERERAQVGLGNVDDSDQGANQALRRFDAAEQALQNAKARAEDIAGDTCPTCGRDGWGSADDERAERKRIVAERAREVDAARVALDEARAEARMRRDETIALADAAVSGARAALAKAEQSGTDAKAEHEAAGEEQAAAEQALAEATESRRAAAEWDRARNALGDEPAEPGETPPEPKAPKHERPSDEAAAEARGVLEAHRRAETLAEGRAEDLGAAEKALAIAESGEESARAEAARLDRLVEAVRAAPSEGARRQLAHLGDLGPVELRLPVSGGCDVRVFGRPWECASRGELVLADVYLRAGLRRALGAEFVPLFVDDRQSWSGELPDVTPRVELVTVAGAEALEVAA